jgi:hypothetical protein
MPVTISNPNVPWMQNLFFKPLALSRVTTELRLTKCTGPQHEHILMVFIPANKRESTAEKIY